MASAGSGCCSSTCRSASPPRCSRRACSPRAATRPRRAHFDVAGAVTVTAGLSLLVYALVDANNAGWGSTQTIGLIAARRSLLLAAFVAIELRSRDAAGAVLDLPHAHADAAPTSSALLIGASLFSMFFFISLYMQQVLGYGALKAGLSYLPLALTIIVSAGRRLAAGDADRLQAGARRRACCSSPPACSGSRRSRSAARFLGDVLGPSLLAAVGLGFAFVPVTIAAVSGVEDRRGRACACGLINTSQQVGGALGLAILADDRELRAPTRASTGRRTSSRR